MHQEHDTNRGVIAWFARNSVAANLLMGFIIIMGLSAYSSIQKQMFPNVEVNYIRVDVSYPGASPQEIEEGILIKIEEAVKDVSEINSTISRAYRNGGEVNMEIDDKEELSNVLDKIKLKVDSIATFPADMEPVNIRQLAFRQQVIDMPIVGDLPLKDLKVLAKEVEDELLLLDNVSLVDVGYPEDEIAIEVNPDQLRKYNLSISDISTAIRAYSTNLSAGQLKTRSGIISVRVENQYYRGEEFAAIPVKVGPGGARVLLGDVAEIRDAFTEGEYYFKYSGKNAIYIAVKATPTQNIVPVAETVKAYIAHKNEQFPEGVSLETMVDMTYYLDGRLDMMLKNLLQGAILVALLLTIFLRFRLAFWVMLGLPVCFLGAVMMMPLLGISLNIISLFAFIMVLGIVVDDAIVIGESAYTEIESKGSGIDNVIRGAKRVATPATFGVLTTIAVFAPFTLSDGMDGPFMVNIAVVVICCLVFSLIESKLILPAHIAHTTFKPVKPDSWRARFNSRFNGFVNGPYKRTVIKAIEWRWAVLMVFVALLMLALGLIQGNFIRMVPQGKVPHDFPSVRVEMNENVPDSAVLDALKIIEKTILDEDEKIKQEFGGDGMVRDILVFNDDRTNGEVFAPLVDESKRVINTFELARRWREAMPEIPAMKSLVVIDDINGGSDDGEFGFLLFGPELETLNAAGLAFIEMLQREDGLFDVSSTIDPASKEVQMTLKPVAYDLGLTLQNIAGQIGSSFYGGEAQRVIRDGEEVKVMVRYPALQRERLADLKYSVITTPAGQEVMLGDIAELTEAPGISYIRRESGYRSVYIWGSIDEQKVEPGEAIKAIYENLLPELQKTYPGVMTELGGDIEEQQAQQDQQMLFFTAAMIMVYILLAVPLKSYSQPLIIMSVIPFSFTGAAFGHFLLGYDLSTMSFFGLIAAAGVVINDSLVMTDFVNQRRRQGYSTRDAVEEAGSARFRAITLTSITTFAGVLPILFETSLQAVLVIPMAIALGFAVMYATLVTLILVPCLYLILIDSGNAFKWLFHHVVRIAKKVVPGRKSTGQARTE